MDKDRAVGAAKELKGKTKEEVGKTVGDAKLETDGKADRIKGKIQNAIGGLKDAIKQKMVTPIEIRQWLHQPFFESIRPDRVKSGASELWRGIGRLSPSASLGRARCQLVAIPITKAESRK